MSFYEEAGAVTGSCIAIGITGRHWEHGEGQTRADRATDVPAHDVTFGFHSAPHFGEPLLIDPGGDSGIC